ncbi:extensin-like [Cyprinodon tularosa]|uniref:extensin-like n=1 Tax=Cyprinodon tularosa TaxID=77115 RepID=UPI0018E1F64E|nr:extensin-like [Cyprinodon tularosa]
MTSGSNSKRQRLPSTKMKDHVQLGTEEEEEAAGHFAFVTFEDGYTAKIFKTCDILDANDSSIGQLDVLRPGERVLARWSDGRFYSATVNYIGPNTGMQKKPKKDITKNIPADVYYRQHSSPKLTDVHSSTNVSAHFLPSPPVQGPPSQGHALPSPPSQGHALPSPPSQGHALPSPPSQGHALPSPPSQGHALPSPPSQGHALPSPPSQGHALPSPPSQGPALPSPPSQGHALPSPPSQGHALPSPPSQGHALPSPPSQGHALPSPPSQGHALPSPPSQGHALPSPPSQGHALPSPPSQGHALPSPPSQGHALPSPPSQGHALPSPPSQGHALPSPPSQGHALPSPPSQGHALPSPHTLKQYTTLYPPKRPKPLHFNVDSPVQCESQAHSSTNILIPSTTKMMLVQTSRP